MGKFYITTAIDYVNAAPHVGHALEKVEADVLARYRRLMGDEVFFLTGTDEHGQKIARAAKEAGKTPQEFADEISEKFRGLKGALNLSYDDFIRTSDRKRHWPGAEMMWKKLKEAGAFEKRTYRGLYCVGHEAFITEKELVDGKCPDHGKKPEVVEEQNWFFKLSEYGPRIKAKIENGEFQIIPEGRKNEMLALIERGLEDVSFSRSRKSLEWGIPVPGDPEQTMYVWCDALTNYLSAIGYGKNEDYKKWWPADVQVIGKDILRFHAAIWPAMLLAAGLELPKKLFVHGFITVNGKKMSKTIGNVLDPVEFIDKLVQKGVPRESAIDAFRYYLLREIPGTEDGDFSEEKFIERYNADLANGLGNLAARVSALGEGQEGKIPLEGRQLSTLVSDKIQSVKTLAISRLEQIDFHEALSAIWDLVRFSDQYINEKQPWKREGEKDTQVVYELGILLREIGSMLAPLLPDAAEKILSSIDISHPDQAFGLVMRFKKIDNLFPRL